ncbi:GNVR domain-containing protein [Persicobacter diffluens]|uniref:Chain-length determining protein n=1 Tax=Persicobacter diffluens TaxID=981 RepID=A0AAN5AKE7_9BACT|nr:chain-length determining protein [Persicobacter diffluens]
MKEQMEIQKQHPTPNYYEEDEIDLVAVAKHIIENRHIIYKSVAICTVIGLLVAIFSPVKYTAKATLIPEAGEAQMGNLGGLAGLAGMAGINIGGMMGDQSTIPPELYPEVVKSWPFQKQLMETEITLAEVGRPITVYEYYAEWKKEQLGAKIKKYTIGLPGTIKKAITGEVIAPMVREGGPEVITKEQGDIREILSELVLVEVDTKTGVISLEVEMPEALASAQMGQVALDYLQKYITDYKTEKARQNLNFIQESFNEKETEFLAVQKELAEFQDKNQFVATAIARTEEKAISDKYNLASKIYQELSGQLEQAKIALKDQMPNFTVLEPISVPIEKSAPKRMLILIISGFIGGFVGLGMIFFYHLKESFVAQYNEG